MYKNKFLFIGSLLISLFHSSFSSIYALPPPPKGWHRHPNEYYIWKYQAFHIKQMEEKYRYHSFLVSSSWGKKIDWLRMYYEGQEANNVAQARKMIVESTEWYLKLLNDSEEIKELITSPAFTIGKLQLRWTFRQLDNNKLFIRGQYVAMATLRDGVITYERYNEDKHDLELILQETYVKACHLVQPATST
ncbi:MAG: hypothetical protein K0S74_1334 [Chlamydiales bacterium]|jgi:hypothetical protein|nr:hypothetical protein [Chlamydiales bacterium]